MRDAKLTFSVPVQTAGAGVMAVATASSNGAVAATMTAATTGSPAITSNDLNYGGLLTNGVSGAVMDNNQDGSVTAADYVRGQILNPLYLRVGLNHTGVTAADTFTVALHGSDTAGFTPSTTTVLASTVYTAAAATGAGIVIVPLQSYAKFVKMVITATTNRSGAAVNITQMHLQTGREGNL
jgi:hypothetical protein